MCYLKPMSLDELLLYDKFARNELTKKEDSWMFTDEMLEKILTDEETHKVPIGAQSTCIHVIERVLEDFGYDFREDANSRRENDSNGNS